MRLLTLTAGLTAALLSSGAVMAQDDGFFNVNYNNIGFDLTQVGGYGELIVRPQGFGDLAYGECIVNFSRDESGAVKERLNVIQRQSANCPKELDWTLSPGEKGFYKITFTKGGALEGETFELFPVLQPLKPEWAAKTPEGYDILGIAPGATREEIEAKLEAEGYEFDEDLSEINKYEGGFTSQSAVYVKGKTNSYTIEDQISVTYSAKAEGSDDAERSVVVARKWVIPAEAKISTAALQQSLQDKYGQGNKVEYSVFYDTEGKVVPGAYEMQCNPDVHQQSTPYPLNFSGSSDSVETRIGCGAVLKSMTSESFDTAGLANLLMLTLVSHEVGHESFWNVWSHGKAAELQERFEVQAGMGSEAPKL